MSTQNLKAHERKRRLEQAALSGRLDEARRFQYARPPSRFRWHMWKTTGKSAAAPGRSRASAP